jgi:hypothetical protein
MALMRQWSTAKAPATMNSASPKSVRRSQRAPDCPVPQEYKVSNGRPALNPNGWLAWRRTGQRTVLVRWRTGLSGVPVASSLGQRLQSGWGL